MADDEAFIALWNNDRDRLRRALALALGDHALATEAVDEALTRAYQHWTRISTYEEPAAWVYRVAANWATSWLRKLRRRPVLPAEALDRPTNGPAPADHDLAAAVASLPMAQRSVVVLRFYLDWPVERIAAALDVPAGTVKSRLHRALAALRTFEEVRP